MPKWATYVTVFGVFCSLLFGWLQVQPQLCAMDLGPPICFVEEAPTMTRQPNAEGEGSIHAPFSLDRLPGELRDIVAAARTAQGSGILAAREARSAAQRADEAAQLAGARRPGFLESRSTSGGVWQGEALTPNAIVHGVRSENGWVTRGEFHVSGTPTHMQISPRLHVAAYVGGQFEGRSNERDQWTGAGRFVFPDGGRYEGTWLPGEAVVGVRTFADGRRYEGQFVDVSRPGFDLVQSGMGVLWSADGRPLHVGRWRDGEFLSE